MQKTTLPQAEKYAKQHQRRKAWLKVVSSLACVVVFVTTYMLILPAITLEQTAFCGIEAHQHEEACYEKNLICGYDAGDHTHTDACYAQQQVLVCTLPESAGHVHTASCVQTQQVLACTEDHAHTDGCYETVETYVCGMNEGDDGHTHTAACYETQAVLVCGQTESEHAHTDACYEDVLICEKEEHTHGLACYSDPEADVETAAVWERSVSGVSLTGLWADDVVAIARTQLGYTESTNNYVVTEDGEMKGYTRYGAWYGAPYGDWDAMFVSFCLYYTGIPGTTVPWEADCAAWVTRLNEKGLYRAASAASPSAGDLVFFDRDGDGRADHVGLAAEVSADGVSLKVIEGDSANMVQLCAYTTGNSTLLGYALLPENPDYAAPADETPADETPADETPADETPADETPADETPADEIPADETPADETPADETPADETPSDESPEDKTPADDAVMLADADEGVAAAGETGDELTITLDVPLDVEVGAGETVKIPFTPELTHEYVYTSTSTGDTYGYIYNASGSILRSDDDSGGSSQFKITYTLTGGTLYYLGVKWYNGSKSGSIPILLQLGMHDYASQNEEGQYTCACGVVAPEGGSCGSDGGVTWTFADGVLTISGSGAMDNYASASAPWYGLRSNITSVVIGDGVTSIGSNAFENCASLTSAEIPAGVTGIGSSAFYNCTSLTSVEIPDSVTSIGAFAFYNCTSLTPVVIPESVTSIGIYAFYNCSSLTSVEIPAGVTIINAYTFSGCTSLTSVEIPDRVTSIGNCAFENCTSLASVEIPTGVTSIGSSAFYNCTSLTSVEIPDSVTSIGGSAFQRCTSLASVEIGDSVTSIGGNAFYNCTSLTSVELPAGVTKINDYTFYGCTSLTSVEIPDRVTSIGGSAFYNCTSLASVTIPDGVTSIGGSAFYNCTSLTSVVIPERVTSIGIYAFYNCTSLASVEIGESVTSIGSSAFQGCTSLTSVKIGDSVISIGGNAFYNCTSLTSVEIGDGVTSIGGNVFYNCTSLTSVEIGESVTSIGSNAFQNCSALTSVTIPVNVKTVGSNVFSGCTALQELVWNAADGSLNTTQSKAGAFRLTVGTDVDNLSADTLEALLKMGCTSVAFAGPNYLTMGGWSAESLGLPLSRLALGQYYVDEWGVIYRIDSEANTASLCYCPPELTSYTVPASLPALTEDGASIPVIGVDSYAFDQARRLESLTFTAPEQITRLADYGFYNAQFLASINGQTTEDGVMGVLRNAAKGVQLFGNTRITHQDGMTSDAVVTESHNVILTISTAESANYSPAVAADGTYQYYTGETAVTTVTISNPDSSVIEDDGTVVRMVFQYSSAEGSLNFQPGTYTLKAANSDNEYQMTVTASSVPNCYVVDIERPRQGDTLSINFGSLYPSPSSGGGTATVWGAILSAEEAEALGGALVPQTDGYQRISWTTKKDEFPVIKKLTTTGSAVMTGDGQGGAYIKGLDYQIAMSRTGDTLEGMGKDHMTSADYTDVLVLPEGAEIAPEIRRYIEEGTYTTSSGSYYWYFRSPEGKTFLTIQNFGTGEVPAKPVLSIDVDGNLVVTWTFKNTDLTTEIGARTLRYILSDQMVYIPEPDETQTYTITNRVSVTQHFSYSEDVVQEAACESSVQVSQAQLKFEKGSGSVYGSYLGERDSFSVTASNPGTLPYDRLAMLSDELPSDYYFTAAQLAQVFLDDPDHQLTVTLSNATLCTPQSQTVTGMNGTTTAETPLQNSGSNTAYHGIETTDSDTASYSATIIIAWADENQLSITVNGGTPVLCAVEGDAIQSVLDSLGYIVTRDVRYQLVWDLRKDGEVVPLPGGGQVKKTFVCTMKDTFMHLAADQKYALPNQYYNGYNYAYAYDGAGEKLASDSEWYSYIREFYLTKGWFLNGEAVTNETVIDQGSVLDYTLQVQHNGSASYYDVLPLVDHMTGAQALLAPKALNSGETWAADCAIVTLEDGTEYYLLSAPGTYDHVWTSASQMADSVTVTKSDSGLDTLIKWYFTGYTGTRTDTVSYRSYVCPSDLLPGALTYSLDNEAWLNDHQSHRLYATVGTGWLGTVLRFDKKIVDEVGDTGPGYTHSNIEEGALVTYRLMLQSQKDDEGNDQEITVRGDEMEDKLPLSIDGYNWDTDKVHIYYMDESENYHVENGTSWSITTSGTDAGNTQQYIRWNPDFSITFRGTAYIYVTLQFPEEVTWQEYARKYGTTTLINTYYVLNVPVSVTHNLSITAEARLQKGVVASGRLRYRSGGISNTFADERLYFSNESPYQHGVTYYVSLYNGGCTNLYLTDMQDRLPRGFQFHESIYTTGTYVSFLSSVSTGYSEYRPVSVYKSSTGTATATYKYVQITPSVRTEGDVQYVTFHFSKSTKGSSADISYDESREMCYLKPGEAIVFYFNCSTGKEAGSDDVSTNIISMPYYDFLNGGVTVADSRTTVNNSSTYITNDGGCDVENNGQAVSRGFIGGTEDTEWLTSQVTVTRSNIKPGITKALNSTTDGNGKVTTNPVLISSTDTLTWGVTVENDGMQPITDYTLTDVMQYPYMFTGAVSYTTYYQNGSSTGVCMKPYYSSLFEILPGDTDDTLQLKSQYGSGSYDTKTLTIGGDPVTLKVYVSGGTVTSGTCEIQVAVSRDASGNAVLSIHLENSKFAIPEKGRGVLTLSTANERNMLENRQFVNTCYITPMKQFWDGTTNKGNVTELLTPFAENVLPTVRNSAPVTTSFGYVTSSTKRITEVLDPTNTAACTDDPNYIVLSGKDKLFYYTISVDNTTPNAMDKLILIDGLPEVGDHTAFLSTDLRFSEFRVSLAENPNFTVTVTDKEGASTTLTSGQYRIEYSGKTEFTSDDWSGTSTWSSSPDGARSIRLIIDDPDGALIPDGSTVSLTFICQIDDPDAQPGQIAWNSFGYHYSLVNDSAELEAAPLKVGVKIPSVPQLKKQVVDHSNQPIAVTEDTEFSFLVYPGTALSGTYKSEEEWTAALGAQSIPYEKYTVTVKAGESVSDVLRLNTEQWTWISGEKYTITELPGSERFAFKSFDGAANASCTFTHDPAQTLTITCVNIFQDWTVSLTKENNAKQRLEGAVFALYSPEETDLNQDALAGYSKLSIEKEVTYDNQTWYLYSVGTTGGEGELEWTGLLRESYYLLEVKAPDGYNLPGNPGQLLQRKYESQGVYSVTVVNTQGYELPETGGTGTIPYTLGGLLLIATACGFLLYIHIKRRKEDTVSF